MTARPSTLVIRSELEGKLPKSKTIGIPFIVISRSPYGTEREIGRNWNFAVRELEPLEYNWPLDQFVSGTYHLEVYGPNGFYREFRGSSNPDLNQPGVSFLSTAFKLTPKIENNKPLIRILCKSATTNPEKAETTSPLDSHQAFMIHQLSYNIPTSPTNIQPGQIMEILLERSFGWYDIEIVKENDPSFYQRYAGHVETGKTSQTDPLMGGVT